MAISPCNSLNVKTIRISQLASVSSANLNGDDVIYISQYDDTNGVYYSKKTSLSDLTDYFNNQGNLSGSFSGSFYGKVYSKNTISTGSFSGSYWGRINSKNTKASGSFSGSHYGAVVSKNTKASGSFSGSYRGSIISKNTKATGSFYGNATTSTTSNTSSYLLQTNQNTTNELGYFDGTRLKSTPGLSFSPYAGGYKLLKLSSSMALSYFQVFSRGYTSLGTKYNQSGLSLFNLNSNEVYPNIDGWNIVSATSGSLALSAPIGSYEFSSSNVVAKSTSSEVYGLVQKRNGFYFWPYMGSNTPARDGAIGIGVQPPNEPTGSFNKYLRAKLHINCYSGSGEGPWSPKATVENRAVAILVQYGSGSATTAPYTTFYVSASGNTYMKGDLTVDGDITTGGGTISGVSVLDNGGAYYNFPTYNSATPTGGQCLLSVAHNLGRKPYMLRTTTICRAVTPNSYTSNNSDIGYVVDDEAELTNWLEDGPGEGTYLDTHMPFTVTSDATYIYFSIPYATSQTIVLMSKKYQEYYGRYSNNPSPPGGYAPINTYWGLKFYVM